MLYSNDQWGCEINWHIEVKVDVLLLNFSVTNQTFKELFCLSFCNCKFLSKMPINGTERNKTYRERIKENPEKYKSYKIKDKVRKKKERRRKQLNGAEASMQRKISITLRVNCPFSNNCWRCLFEVLRSYCLAFQFVLQELSNKNLLSTFTQTLLSVAIYCLLI